MSSASASVSASVSASASASASADDAFVNIKEYLIYRENTISAAATKLNDAAITLKAALANLRNNVAETEGGECEEEKAGSVAVGKKEEMAGAGAVLGEEEMDTEVDLEYLVHQAAEKYYVMYGNFVYTMKFFLDESNGSKPEVWDETMNTYEAELIAMNETVVAALGYAIIPMKTPEELIKSFSTIESKLHTMINNDAKDDNNYEKVGWGRSGMKASDDFSLRLQECVDEYRSAYDETIHYLLNIIEHGSNEMIRVQLREQITIINNEYDSIIDKIEQLQVNITFIEPSRFLLRQQKFELQLYPRRCAVPMKLHELLKSPLSKGILEYKTYNGDKTLIKLVNKENNTRNNQKLYELLVAFGLAGDRGGSPDNVMTNLDSKLKHYGFRVNTGGAGFAWNRVSSSKYWEHSEFDKNNESKCRGMFHQSVSNSLSGNCDHDGCNMKKACVTVRGEAEEGENKTAQGERIPFHNCNVHIGSDEKLKELKWWDLDVGYVNDAKANITRLIDDTDERKAAAADRNNVSSYIFTTYYWTNFI